MHVEVSVQRSGESAIAANYEPGANLAAWVDRALLPGRMYEKTWDPEGLLSTVPAVATGIFGMLVGAMILGIGDPYRRVSWIFFVGVLAVVVGGIWNWVFPYNKNLWSSSFVLFTGGWSAIGLAACLLLIDILRIRKWAQPGVVFGSNPVVAYALSGMLGFLFYGGMGIPSMSAAWMSAADAMQVPAKLASLLYALFYVCMIYLPVLWLWKRRVFVKL